MDDVELGGRAGHAAFARSPHAHARMRSIDTAAAKAAPGVIAVATGRELAEIHDPWVGVLTHLSELVATWHYVPRKHPFAFTNGVQASYLEVDVDTGFITLIDHWCIEDCGTVINPLLVDEQIRGASCRDLAPPSGSSASTTATGRC